MRHLYIPDTQVRPGVCINHLNALGNWIVDKQPEKIICGGDWADMPSLSSYDFGKKAIEGRRYALDIQAAKMAMEVLLKPLKNLASAQRKAKHKVYQPVMIFTLGNHENRINKYVNDAPILDGKVGVDDLEYSHFGWKVFGFLEPVTIDGILYSHFFPRNASGRVTNNKNGAPNARAQVQREGCSCTSGHLQGLDFHIQQRGTRRDYGLIAGSFYLHEEEYLTPQGTAYWRGVVVKNEVIDGMYDPMFLSINYLIKTYWDGVNYTTPSEL